MEQKTKTWTVKRWVLEMYEVDAPTREEALQLAIDPGVVTVTKETCVPVKKDVRADAI